MGEPHTSTTDLTATIRANDLAYLNWKPIHSVESVCISMVELHVGRELGSVDVSTVFLNGDIDSEVYMKFLRVSV
jgi:hypothetical protein